MNDKCDACNVGFFNFPTCEGNQCLNQTSINQQMNIFISKLVIVMLMAHLELCVMAMVFVVAAVWLGNSFRGTKMASENH